MKKSSRRSNFILYSVMFLLIAIFIHSSYEILTDKKRNNSKKISKYDQHLLKRGFTEEQIQNMSILGKWLLAPEKSLAPIVNYKKQYLILIWRKYPIFLRYSQLENCPVKNCRLSFNKTDLQHADAVFFPLSFTEVSDLPARTRTDQRWIFFITWPSLISTYYNQKLSDYNGIFNWSMTYRMESDVPIPIGRTIVRHSSIKSSKVDVTQKWRSILKNSKTRLLVIYDPYCSQNTTWRYFVDAMKKILGEELDILGCLTEKNGPVCHDETECSELKMYKFYMSFEEFNCEALMFKTVWNAYENYAVPIISGPSYNDCKQLLPPNSFIHVYKFWTITKLTQYLTQMQTLHYYEYHKWRDNYTLISEQRNFGNPSLNFCRICQALNYNVKKTKVYNDLEKFLNVKTDCPILLDE